MDEQLGQAAPPTATGMETGNDFKDSILTDAVQQVIDPSTFATGRALPDYSMDTSLVPSSNPTTATAEMLPPSNIPTSATHTESTQLAASTVEKKPSPPPTVRSNR